MSRIPERSLECEALNDDLIEFALGTLSGRRRSVVLDHLEHCDHCNTEVESLADVADNLLWLAPEAEPPLGFESRVMERLRHSEGGLHRTRRAGVLAVAALLAALMGVGIGAAVTNHGGVTNPSATARPTTGRLMTNGHVVGVVIISAGKPSWMVMNVDSSALSGVVWCEVTLIGGRTQDVGSFTISHGYGSWAVPIKVSGDLVRTARIVNVNGTVLAQATLAA